MFTAPLCQCLTCHRCKNRLSMQRKRAYLKLQRARAKALAEKRRPEKPQQVVLPRIVLVGKPVERVRLHLQTVDIFASVGCAFESEDSA